MKKFFLFFLFMAPTALYADVPSTSEAAEVLATLSSSISVPVDFDLIIQSIAQTLGRLMGSAYGVVFSLFMILYAYLSIQDMLQGGEKGRRERERIKQKERRQLAEWKALTPQEREYRRMQKLNRDMDTWARMQGYTPSSVRRSDRLKREFYHDYFSEDF